MNRITNSVLKKFLCIFPMLTGCFFVTPLFGENSVANAIALDQNQKIVLAGRADDPINSTSDFAIARLNLDGSVDTTFNPQALFGVMPGVVGQVIYDIQGTNDIVNALAIDQNNKIVVAGSSTVIPSDSINNPVTTAVSIARLNPDGSLDTTFNPIDSPTRFAGLPGTAVIPIGPLASFATGVAIDSNNNIIITGNANNGTIQEVAVIRLLHNGQLDTSFNPVDTQFITTFTPGIITINIQAAANDTATAVALDELNSIYIGGYTNNGLNTQFFVTKVLPTGDLDPTFNPFSLNPGIAIEGIQDFDNQAYALKLDSHKNIVIGGFSNNSLTANFALMRFTPEGVLDPTFNPSGAHTGQGIIVTSVAGIDDEIHGLTIDADNRIVVTGFANNGINRAFATGRYNFDGSLDTTFNPGGTLPGVVVTNVIPTQVVTQVNNNNEGRGVIINDTEIFVGGFSNDTQQLNFTTVNYLANGQLNTEGFNATVFQPGFPGIVFTVFGVAPVLLGNGVPTFVGGDVSGISPEILEDLRYPPVPIAPVFTATGPLLTNEDQPIFEGIATPNAFITIFANDFPVGTVLADSRGNWSVAPAPLPDGTYTIVAESYDALTGLTLASQPTALTILTEVPPPPIIATPVQESTLRSAAVPISGISRADLLITVYIDDKPIGETHANQKGSWYLETPALAEGEHTLYATATDQAGNVSDPSSLVTFKVDLGAQKAPRIFTPKNNVTLTTSSIPVSGDGKIGTRVNIYLNEKLKDTVAVNGNGYWTYTLKDLQDGQYNVRATTEDKSLSSERVTFIVALPAPAKSQEKAASLKVRVDTTEADSAVRSKGLVNGTAQPLSLITIFLDGVKEGTTRADAQGAWSFTPITKVAPGKHAVKVSVADKTGRVLAISEQEVSS